MMTLAEVMKLVEDYGRACVDADEGGWNAVDPAPYLADVQAAIESLVQQEQDK